MKTKLKKKKYCFEMNVARGVDLVVLEVKYNYNLPVLSIPFEGESYKGVFGYTYFSLESLLINKEVKGPCWL
jgi:hypothetical protein